MAEENPLEKLIKRRHPEYEGREAHWDFLESCYEGGRDWFRENIFKFWKEGENEYSDRVERAYRFNHSREVVDLVNKYLFRPPIHRRVGDAPDSVQRFWRKSTKNGMDIDAFVRQVARRSSIFGRIYIVVDNNAAVAPRSKAEEKEQDIRAYAYIVKPQDALDMSFDEDGKLNWILIRERFRRDEDPFDEATDVEFRYRLWTKNAWYLFEERERGDSRTKTVEQVASGEHGLGEVPVIPTDHIEDDNPYFSPALINDIAYLDRAVANYLSNLDAIIQDQTFSQLAMPAQGLMPGDEGDVKKQLVELGTKRIFIYNGEGGSAPMFLSPDPRQAQLIITAIRTIINEIYHTVGMAGERTKQDNAMGIDNSSGVAKAYDFDRVNALLCAKARNMQRLENEIARVVAKWHGEEDRLAQDSEPLVKYSDNFDVRGLLDEFDIAARLAMVQAPDEVRRRQMESLINKLFPSLSREIKEAMFAELKSWPPKLEEVGGVSGDFPTTPKRPTQGSVQAEE